jgi:hypothetical protein
MDSTLSEKLANLRTTIEQLEGLPEGQKDQLLQNLNDLEQTVPSQDDNHLPPLLQLEESMLSLEAKHPDATQLLKGVAEALGRMGL